MADNNISRKINWSHIRKMALVAMVVFVLLCYVGGGILIHDSSFANQMLLCPDAYNETYEISLPGIKKQSLTIPAADGQSLDAWLFVVPGAKKLVIVNHGNAGNLTSRGIYAQAFSGAKTNVLLYDYRGYGKSTGPATVHGILDDGMSVYSYARNVLHYPAERIIEFGESIGSAVACHVAAKEKCGALMLFAPIDSLPSAGKWTVPLLNIYPDFCFAEQLNNAELITKIRSPIFVCHGQKDETLRSEGSQRFYDAASQPKNLVYLPNSGHFEMTAEDQDLYLKSLAKFVGSLH